MKLKYICLSIACYLLLSGCEGLSEKKVVGNYVLVAMDNVKDHTTLSYKIEQNGNSVGVIDEMVFAVGYDSNFIIAAQHPGGFSVKPNLKITNYFIVVMANRNEYSGTKNVFGPFNESEFGQKRKELGVPAALDFSISVD